MKDVLKEIIGKKKERLLKRMQDLPQESLLAKIQTRNSPAPFVKSINKPHAISLIAEIKQSSPSCGLIRQDFDCARIAVALKESGAAAISFLTEEDYFSGEINRVEEIKKAVDLPVLRKDFIIHPYQIYEARAFGCDALLLIAELLSQQALSEFLALAAALNMDCLVEVNNEKDLKKALKVKSPLIGINNRNLHTLEVDLKTTQRLFPLIPKEKPVVAESGIRAYQDVLFLKVLGVKSVLIGEAFMEAPDIKAKVREIMGWSNEDTTYAAERT